MLNGDRDFVPYEGPSEFTFGGSAEDNQKIVEDGFEMKVPFEDTPKVENNSVAVDSLISPVHESLTPFKDVLEKDKVTFSDVEDVSKPEELWKDRYFKLLEVVKTFKG